MHFFLIRTSIFFKDNKIAQPVGQVYFVVFENYKWGRGGGEGDVHLRLGFSARISLLCRRLKSSIFLIQPVSKLRARFSLFHLLQL